MKSYQSTILRKEERLDREGNEEIFIQVEIETEDDTFTKGYWIQGEDAKAIKDYPSAFDTIVQRITNRAVKARPKQLRDEVHAQSVELEKAKSYDSNNDAHLERVIEENFQLKEEVAKLKVEKIKLELDEELVVIA